MHRHMNLIQLILEYVEDQRGFGNIELPRFREFNNEEVAYHVRLCSDAGYLILVKDRQETRPAIVRMTWCGHKALEKLQG